MKRDTVETSALWTLPFIGFALLTLFSYTGFFLLWPTLGPFLEDFGHDQAAIGQIFAGFTIASILVRCLSEWLTYRFKPTTLIQIGLLACGAAGLCYYGAHGYLSALGVRLLHGAGFGLASTLAVVLASYVIPPSRMGEGMGYLGLGSTLALALGPFLGVWLAARFGYAAMFIFVAAFYVVGIPIVLFATKSRPELAKRTTVKPRLVFISGKVLIQSFLMFLLGLVMSSVGAFLALLCKEKNLPHSGDFFLFSAFGILASRLFAGRLHDKYGHGWVILPFSVILGATMLMLGGVETRGMLLFLAVTYGLANGALLPSFQALTLSSVDTGSRTEATASFFNAYDLGIGVGSALMGMIALRAGSYNAVFVTSATITVVLLSVYLWRYGLTGCGEKCHA